MPEDAKPPVPADPGQLRKLREEQAKLSATWVNGVSLAFAVVGVIQPLTGGPPPFLGRGFFWARRSRHTIRRS
jgi:hypothetical protein